jgi:hypothetical protein
MVDLFSTQTGYDIGLVSASGRVVARTHGHPRSFINDALELPYVSASNTRVYYLDGDQQVRWVKPDGTLGNSVTIPGAGPQVHAAFAVSLNDTRMAVSLLDYSVSPVALTLYVQDIGTGSRAVIFTSTTKYVWPVGWRNGQLVVAYIGPNAVPFKSKAIMYTNRDLISYPYGPNPYGGINVHVISPETAVRSAIVGGGGNSGLLTAAGSAVVQGGTVDWSGQYGTYADAAYGSISSAASLSPDGHKIVACCWPTPAAAGQLAVWFPDGTSKPIQAAGTSGDWEGWFDNTHFVTGFYQRTDGTSSLVDIESGTVIPVDVHGIVAAMLPGGFDS